MTSDITLIYIFNQNHSLSLTRLYSEAASHQNSNFVSVLILCYNQHCANHNIIVFTLYMNLTVTLKINSKISLATERFYFYNCPLSSEASQHAQRSCRCAMLNQNKLSCDGLRAYLIVFLTTNSSTYKITTICLERCR